MLPDFKRKEADIVFKARLRERDIVCFLLLEMQSTVDMEMPLRLLMYQTEIWRYILRNRDGVKSVKSAELPVIVPIVLYNGSRPWTAKRRFRQLLAGEEAFGEELLDFGYILLDVERYSEEELLRLSNTIGAVFLLDQTADQLQLLERLRKLMKTIHSMPEPSKGQFLNWLTRVVAVHLPKERVDVEKFLQDMKDEGGAVMGLHDNLQAIRQKGVEEGLAKGIEEGIERGHKQGKAQVAKNLIDLGMDNRSIAIATDLAEAEIERLRKEIH
ncbi:Rpn family recombination-promoting nuclease/putative transposase [Paenibacillus hexagrammi]|uniref:Rpn family recombination-promoting nuclease/putative transposase n=1 Tax=Paenibacillus hexagrammi TaxID=2908839 RepID=A0ABY3SGG3_9BACL|nr:Rpn family recombination-promoting nuclease/putative transposase [Paenibacillus sp. YPD9-1]UJF32540.1 Rpn family recombination-promoting nuclease/putative transposase [Paenibacillus sp. YPD9-1]